MQDLTPPVFAANALNSLAPIFDEKAVKAGFEIAGTLIKEAGTFLGNRAQESTQAKAELDKESAKPVDQQDQGRITQLTQTLKDNATWEMGGTGRTVLTALTAAVGGNVTGSTAQVIQGAAVNYLQSLGAQEIKQLATELGGEGSPAHTALHALLACTGAAAQGSNCGTAALGASAGVVINTLLGGDVGKMTPEQKEARKNLVTGLVTGIAKAAGADNVAVATNATTIETENNGLKEYLFPRNLPRVSFKSAIKGPDDNLILVDRQATIDKDRNRITLIQPSERGLYAAGTGGAQLPGYTVIFSHASETSIMGVDMNDPAAFNAFVSMIKNSGAWQPGQPILLDACNSGKIDQGIASALAKALNTAVVAPTTQTWNIPSWSTSVVTGAFEPTIQKGNSPNIQAPGDWRTFAPNGSLIATSKYPPGAPFPSRNP